MPESLKKDTNSAKKQLRYAKIKILNWLLYPLLKELYRLVMKSLKTIKINLRLLYILYSEKCV